ncbi:MAG: SsrA-binding protein SmpB [Oscillospiraceae bacterium]|nr:SsrA-binding protein SmpB [Oscillospiraceae bacterium]
MAKSSGERVIAENRQARHEYFVLEALEAGIELVGTEVKSIRMGGVNLKDSWCEIRDGEIYAIGVHISPYEKGNIFNRDPRRERRLLIHKSEIRRLYDKVRQEGLTIVPLKLYYKGSRVKMEIGLCKGKKLYDKRDDMAKRQTERDIERVLKERNQ